jgi:hypothetical protein
LLGQLKDVVDLLASSVERFKTAREDRARKDAALDLLVAYFALRDVVADGRQLLASIGPDPAAQLSALTNEAASALIREWADIAERQSSRLYSLASHLTGQASLDVVAPSLRDDINGLIGSKFEQADSLHGIGAGLVFFSMFGGRGDRDWLLAVVRSMIPHSQGGPLDLARAREDLSALEKELERYRQVCERLLTDEEIVALSKKARDRVHEMTSTEP